MVLRLMRVPTEQVVGGAQLLEVQEEEALDEAPEVAEREEEENEAHDVRHAEQFEQVRHDVVGGHVAADGHEHEGDARHEQEHVVGVEGGRVVRHACNNDRHSEFLGINQSRAFSLIN